MILTIICGTLAVCYGVLMIAYMIGYSCQRSFQLPASYAPATRISVIIPARNESASIDACIRSILAQQYPAGLYEVIVVDDHSEDDTALKVAAYKDENVRLISLKEHIADRNELVAFKKKALSIGIAHSAGELIITTDADCIAAPQWLANMAALYQQTQAKLIVAPVDFTSNNSLVEIFQSLDFMTMQGITAAAQQLGLGNMANGANFAFTRAAYEAVNGYEGVDHFASGDDYLLMVKIKDRFPDGIQYLKSQQAIIRTTPQPDWASFFQQRIRWASKSGKYKDPPLTAVLLLVYLFNVSFPVMLAAGCFDPGYLQLCCILLSGKIVVELIFLVPVSAFFGKTKQLIVFPLLQPLHVLYICLAGFLGWKGKFQWKGRNVK